MRNRPSTINDNDINRLPQVEFNILFDEFPVTETTKAIQHLSSGKAPGSDAVPAEIYKAGYQPMAEKLTELVHCLWRKEPIQQEFKDVTTYASGREVYGNYRGISLLSIAGKILANILLNHLNEHLVQAGLLPESQCGFRKDRETIDIIFTPRQLQGTAT